jgi:NAD(P)-dependent dehydrogenase (short-subunit alcohol dehydrogenase family)
VSIETDVEAMIAKRVAAYGRLDCAVNNAGVVRFNPIIDETTEGFNSHVDTNLRGVFYCKKHISGHGAISASTESVANDPERT